MDFRIADTFIDSLARLNGNEQKAVKTTAFDLQLNPASPGMSFHKLDKAKDKNFWSVRVNSDIRIIVHKTATSILVCFVGHHDKAYSWAERRKLETHPTTGAAQLVEIRETVQEIHRPQYVVDHNSALRSRKPPIFEDYSDDDLLEYGVPLDWLGDVRTADEDTIFGIVDHLPAEAAEKLLAIATGDETDEDQAMTMLSEGDDLPDDSSTDDSDALFDWAASSANVDEPEKELSYRDVEHSTPFDHPDAQRRFRIIANAEELERALDSPWEKWTVFLHPDQRHLVERDYSGPARISGSAGTGKTVVALHRAVHLARSNPRARVLLTTISDALASLLKGKLNRLISNEPQLAERIDVDSLDTVALRLYKAQGGKSKLAKADVIEQALSAASAEVGIHKFTGNFIQAEWNQIVDAWQIESWEQYREVPRLGRKTRLLESQRKLLWSIFDQVRFKLLQHGLITQAGALSAVSYAIAKSKKSPYDFSVVDECQDVDVPQMRFLAAMIANRPNGLFFTGDLGQRIFQQPFSWKLLGIDIRGRSHVLHVNYRTSHQIRAQIDRLLGPELTDVDGIVEGRRNTVSVFNGPVPVIRVLDSEDAEAKSVGDWLKEKLSAGVSVNELGVIVRSTAQLDRAKAAAKIAEMQFKILDEQGETNSNQLSICTMHLAKGMEFRGVAVMACDDEVMPLQIRIESVGDDADLQDVYDTERYLLYVACTRAREHLLVTGVRPASEFLDDLRV